MTIENNKPARPRGFAAMDPAIVKEIARKGGKAAHAAGTAHEFNSEEATIAGRKGGRATHMKRGHNMRDAVAQVAGNTNAPAKSDDQAGGCGSGSCGG